MLLSSKLFCVTAEILDEFFVELNAEKVSCRVGLGGPAFFLRLLKIFAAVDFGGGVVVVDDDDLVVAAVVVAVVVIVVIAVFDGNVDVTDD